VGDQVADGVGVADHEALEAPGVAQHLREQPVAGRRGNAVEVHVRGHHVARPGLDRGLERREVDVPQLVVRQVDLVVIAATERGPVPAEVFGAGDDSAGALEAADLCRGDRGAQYGILAGALDDPAPARITGDVDHGGERPVNAHRAGLAAGDGLAPLDDVRVPGGGHGDRHREDGAQTVDHIEAEQRRDAVPIALDGEPLQPVDLGRVGDE
jgi:hypothetical protein